MEKTAMNGAVKIPRWLFLLIPTAGIIVGIGISWGFQQATISQLLTATEQYEKRLTRIEESLKELPAIRTDIDWIKKTIDKGK
jgi:hypothetical protein